MRYIKKIKWLFECCILGSLLLIHISTKAQSSTMSDTDIIALLKARNKQVDQFIDRLNQAVEANDFHQIKGKISQLFEKNYLAKLDGDYVADFVANSIDRAPLSFYDKNWYASVHVRAYVEGIKRDFILLLKVNAYPPNNRSKWVIVDVIAPFLSVDAECPAPSTIIPPSSHGSKFIGLKRVFRDEANIQAYADDNYQVDELSILFYLVKNHLVVFQEVLEVQYYFLQMKNWIFKLNYFNRRSFSAGWLIDEITQIPDREKQGFLRRKLESSLK